MTYNVHEAVGRDKRRDYKRVIEVIKEINPDIMALQEVDVRNAEASDTQSFLFEAISEIPEYSGTEGITMIRSRSSYGNAVFAKAAKSSVRRHDISFRHREPRGALDCTFHLNNQLIRVVNTHLGLKKYERKWQIHILKNILKENHELPLLFSGDFNEWNFYGRRRLRTFENEFKTVPVIRTFPSGIPLFALDRIFYNNKIRLKDFHRHKTDTSRLASDHLPIVARFALLK